MATGANSAVPRTPVWRTAIVALAIFATISEGAYLLLGSLANTCFAENSRCDHVAGAFSASLFSPELGANGAQLLYSRLAFGLPGLNNLFYALYNPDVLGDTLKFAAIAAISVLVGFMMIVGFLATAWGRGLFVTLFLTVGFAACWFLLYNVADLSIFGGEFTWMLQGRYLEIPVATLALSTLIPMTRERLATTG